MSAFSPHAPSGAVIHGRSHLRAPRLRLALASLFAAWALFSASPVVAQTLTPADLVMGFEDASAWQVAASAPTTVSTLSSIRTQGAAALSVSRPGESTKLTSAPVSSAASQLIGIGTRGSVMALDVRVLTTRRTGWERDDDDDEVTLRLSILAPSQGLTRIPLGRVELERRRPGTFQTVLFPLTDQARRALGSAALTDLRFELALTTEGSATYLLDNLRVRSALGVTATVGTTPPVGFGGSVDFDVDLDAPAPVPDPGQTFPVGPIQVPARFHVKSGTAAPGSSVQLELGYSAASLVVTCVYLPDPLDSTQTSMVIGSCQGGPRPGDLISASWARLQILNGVSPMRVKAQLALRPLGDQLGSRLIPPMPTFWGDDDACVTEPVAGQVLSSSQSCDDMLAETSTIIDDYFAAATQRNDVTGWIVAPVPDFAKRRGDGTPQGVLAPPTPLAARSLLAPAIAGSASSPFNESGHMNEGGLFDAYWQLVGNASYNSFPNTDRATTHFDVDFSTSAVLLGLDVTALDVFAAADSDTGETTPSHSPASSHVETRMHVFGIEYPGFTTNTSGQLNQQIPLFNPPPFDLPPIRFWIFKIQAGVKAQVGLTLSGGLSARGVDLTLTPEGSIAGHLFGGVDIFVASAGVDASVDLIRVAAPVAARVEWFLDPAPTSCMGSLTGSLDSDLTLSSGGGHVDLVVSYGICPFCDDESVTLFDWGPLASSTVPVLHESLALGTFPLPVSLCTGNAITASIQTPTSAFSPVYGTVTYPLTGLAFSNNVSTSLGQNVDCANFTWSTTNPADVISGQGCHAQITFANTAHQAQINLAVSRTVTDAQGRQLTESGSTTALVNVSQLVGVRLVSFLNLTTGTFDAFPLRANTGPPVDGYIIAGSKVQPTPVNPVRYSFVITYGGVSQDITCGAANPGNCVFNGSGGGGVIVAVNPFIRNIWTPPDQEGLFTITYTAIDTVTNQVLGTDSTDAAFRNIIH